MLLALELVLDIELVSEVWVERVSYLFRAIHQHSLAICGLVQIELGVAGRAGVFVHQVSAGKRELDVLRHVGNLSVLHSLHSVY